MPLSRIQIALLLVIGMFHSSLYSQINILQNIVAVPTASSFAYPQSVFVDSPSGHIWITDFSNHRVLRFDVSSLTSVMEPKETSLPASMILYQNYPNPFNPTTVVSYSVAGVGGQWSRQETGGQAVVSLKVYDLLGREVAVLVNGRQEPGQYAVAFNAGGLPSGMYLYSLRSANGTEVKRMCLLK
jgi:hypothetical protein